MFDGHDIITDCIYFSSDIFNFKPANSWFVEQHFYFILIGQPN
jgi:hypothetical protein